ncbi:hypothetical protein BGZ91_008478, partial [Linnemannia elongata]
HQGPVSIDVVTNTNTQYIEWRISDGSLPKGLFELVLGISSQDLDLNAVDSITFDYVCETNQAPRRPSEVIPNTTLRNLFATLPAGDSVLRWKLYERIATDSGAGGAIKIIMTIEGCVAEPRGH